MYANILLALEATENDYSQSLASAFLILIVALGASWLAYSRGYYKRPDYAPVNQNAIHTVDLFGAFLLFLGFQLVIMPELFKWAMWLFHKLNSNTIGMSLSRVGWYNLLTMVLTLFVLLFYTWIIGKSKIIWNRWGKGSNGKAWDFLLGVITWFISYPIVLGLSEFISSTITYFVGAPPVDQEAVSYLKTLIANKPLFWFTGIVMATVIPATEELIFRGFLQNWFVGRCGRLAGVLATAAIFALFHAASDQGIHNLDIVIPLFTLACFLGYLYERQQTLWASIGLHATFNAMSLGMLFFSENG